MIRHALVDADGVLQDLPGGWAPALEPFLGERAEDAAELYRAVWHRIEVPADTIEFVRRLRSAGTRVNRISRE